MSEDFSRQVAGRILGLRRGQEDWKVFAKRVGLSAQIVSNWRKGSGASLDAAVRVLGAHAPRLSARWLLTGEPPQWAREPSEAEAAALVDAEERGYRLEIIGRLVGGELDEAALTALRQGRPEAIADALADLIGPTTGEA